MDQTTQMNKPEKPDDQEKTFMGQPVGLKTMFTTEMWERFSYYGMRAILLYYMWYMIDQGQLDISRATASSIMAIYASMVYLSGSIGGFVADRLLGARRTVFWGGVLIMLGHIALALPAGAFGLFSAMVLIVIGTGLLKPNASALVGSLYEIDDPRREVGFAAFVFAVNFGSFIAPLAVGWTQGHYGYHAAFALAAIGMFFALIYYQRGQKDLPADSNYAPDPIQPSEIKPLLVKIGLGTFAFVLILILMQLMGWTAITDYINLLTIVATILPVWYFVSMLTSPKVSATERSRVWAYVPLFIAAILFWAIQEQGSIVLAIFAADRVSYAGMPSWVSPAMFQSLNPLFVMLYAPIAARLWLKMGKKQPSAPSKFALGLVFAGASFLLLAIPGFLNGTDVKVSPWWLVASWALVVVGEILISPVGLNVTTKLAPRAFMSQMVAMWFLASAAGSALNAQLVRLYTPEHEVSYFTWFGLAAIALSLVLFALVKHVKKLMAGVN